MPALRRLRQAAGLTQVELARLIPDKTRTKTLTHQVISGWERGEYEPELTLPQIKALCRALKVSLEDLPDDLGPPKRLVVDVVTEEGEVDQTEDADRGKPTAVRGTCHA